MQFNAHDGDNSIIIFNTPKGLNISEVFTEFSNKDLPKIEFILNQINYNKDIRGYQVHIGNHAWSLCMTRNEIVYILDTLVNLNIIIKASEATPGLNSNGYVMVSPYTNDESDKSFYNVTDHLFLRKLQADKWVCKGKEHSNFKKDITPVKPSTDTASILIAENTRLQAEIESLKAEIARLSSASSNSTVEPVMNPEPEPDNELEIYSIPDDPECDFITFNYRGKLGCIMNYSDMAYWFDSLSEAKKHQVIIGIINGDYHINEHTVVDMEKVDNPEDAFMFNYWGINTLMTA